MKLSVIFYYHPLNRYSFNALAGAADTNSELAGLAISTAKTRSQLKMQVSENLRRCDRLVVGFSVLAPQLEELKELAADLRSEASDRITLIAGGAHATADPARLLGTGIDIVFRGEAEVSFPAVLKSLLRKEDFRQVPGIAFRRGNEVVFTPPALPVDIEGFPSISPGRGMAGPVEITRGCPFACSYCQTSHLFGTRPRHRSVDNIIRQVAAMRSRKRKVVRVLSPNAFSYGSDDGRRLNLDAIGNLLAALDEAVGPEGRVIFGHFPSEARPEHITPETLELLRRHADNDEIVIGAQSGSRRMLEVCRRSHTVEDVLTAASLARRFGYKLIVDFILGLPGETDHDVQDTMKLIKELFLLGARVHPHAFVPLPQTAFARQRPGEIPREITDLLAQLEKRRAVYGDWVAQRIMAERISGECSN